jgi:hypothetical protein
VTVKYGERWFGNSYDMPDYKLSDNSTKPRIGEPSVDLSFTFQRPVGGRGVGDSQGYVAGATLGLSAEHARRLAVNILWVLEQDHATTISLVFGKAAQEA